MSFLLDGGRSEIRLGRWQDVLRDVRPDCVIVDAPYSARTHAGHDAGRRSDVVEGETTPANPLSYEPWDEADVSEFVAAWSPRTTGWIVSITDHVLATAWANHLAAAGRYVFAPLPFVEVGGRVRLVGDGPSSWTCWVVVARPRTPDFARWGTTRGAYIAHGREAKASMGGKPLSLMRQIVRDYSRPGQLVVDPCAGAATTLRAAVLEGRNALGAERNAAQYELGVSALHESYRGLVLPPTEASDAWLARWRRPE